MSPKPWLRAATLCVVVTGLCVAQDERLPEEAERDRQRAAARAALERFERGLAEYGRGYEVKARPPSRKELLWRAEKRLEQPYPSRPEREPARRIDQVPTNFDARKRYRQLSELREQLLTRLRELAPARHPVPRPEPRPESPRRFDTFYDVVDLTNAPPDYPGPTIGLAPPPSGGVLSYDDGFSLGSPLVYPDTLLDILETELPDLSDEARIEYTGGKLIARLSQDEHAVVARVLSSLRAKLCGQVEFEFRLYRLPQAVYAELRARALALTAADEARLEGADVTLLQRFKLAAMDGQRVSVVKADQRSLVMDLEVKQTGAVPVLNPVIGIVYDGAVLEVRPVVDQARDRVLVDLSLGLGALGAQIASREFKGYELKFPDMRIARTSGTAMLEIGAGALFGGAVSGEDDEGLTSVVYVKVQLAGAK